MDTHTHTRHVTIISEDITLIYIDLPNPNLNFNLNVT